ncbi:MAG: DUF6370 family protein [Gemmataceae bacterium]
MKLVWKLGVSLALTAFLAASAQAADKEVTLQGKITCAKCTLNLSGIRKCTTCIQVKEGDKNVVYLFLDKGMREAYHHEVCGGGAKEGTVTGAVFEKDGTKWIKPREVKYLK